MFTVPPLQYRLGTDLLYAAIPVATQTHRARLYQIVLTFKPLDGPTAENNLCLITFVELRQQFDDVWMLIAKAGQPALFVLDGQLIGPAIGPTVFRMQESDLDGDLPRRAPFGVVLFRYP